MRETSPLWNVVNFTFQFRARAINVIKRIERIPVRPGMVVPVDLTVAFPAMPVVTYGIQALPPIPEYKRVEIPPYKGVAERMPKVGYV